MTIQYTTEEPQPPRERTMFGWVHEGGTGVPRRMSPVDLARFVAALTPEQRREFEEAGGPAVSAGDWLSALQDRDAAVKRAEDAEEELAQSDAHWLDAMRTAKRHAEQERDDLREHIREANGEVDRFWASKARREGITTLADRTRLVITDLVAERDAAVQAPKLASVADVIREVTRWQTESRRALIVELCEHFPFEAQGARSITVQAARDALCGALELTAARDKTTSELVEMLVRERDEAREKAASAVARSNIDGGGVAVRLMHIEKERDGWRERAEKAEEELRRARVENGMVTKRATEAERIAKANYKGAIDVECMLWREWAASWCTKLDLHGFDGIWAPGEAREALGKQLGLIAEKDAAYGKKRAETVSLREVERAAERVTAPWCARREYSDDEEAHNQGVLCAQVDRHRREFPANGSPEAADLDVGCSVDWQGDRANVMLFLAGKESDLQARFVTVANAIQELVYWSTPAEVPRPEAATGKTITTPQQIAKARELDAPTDWPSRVRANSVWSSTRREWIPFAELRYEWAKGGVTRALLEALEAARERGSLPFRLAVARLLGIESKDPRHDVLLGRIGALMRLEDPEETWARAQWAVAPDREGTPYTPEPRDEKERRSEQSRCGSQYVRPHDGSILSCMLPSGHHGPHMDGPGRNQYCWLDEHAATETKETP